MSADIATGRVPSRHVMTITNNHTGGPAARQHAWALADGDAV